MICYVELACVSDFHWICPGFRGNQGKSYMQICCCRCLGNFKVECVPGFALFFFQMFFPKKNCRKSSQIKSTVCSNAAPCPKKIASQTKSTMLWRLPLVCAALLLLSPKNKSKSNQANCVEEFAFGSRFVQHCWSNKIASQTKSTMLWRLPLVLSLCSTAAPIQKIASQTKSTMLWRLPLVLSLCSTAAPIQKIASQTKSTVLWHLLLVLSVCAALLLLF